MERVLARFALLATLALIALGGVVHTTGSSLACPDWPLCGGDWMPAMVGGVRFEHSHRLLALLVVGLVVALAVVTRGTPRARIGLAALALVVVQALLGATTVLLRLPPAVSIAHLACATALGALLLSLAWPAPTVAAPAEKRTQTATGGALAAVLTQMGLGALVRHLHAGSACADDLVRCAGTFTPTYALGWLHLAHRALALVVVALVLVMAHRVSRDGRASSSLRRLARASVLLVALQVGLGFATVASFIALSLTTLHLIVAEVLMLVLFAARAHARPVDMVKVVRSEPATSALRA